ncbi:MAG: GatB/YqeY domain-containing protein [Deltaproteobacteria bacterium]|nr:GatB/YqeY domain-containing protein [Deltaproteobacteria bacterium]
MPIQDDVRERLTEAMKARDVGRTSALRLIRAALLEEEKSGRGAVDDDRAIDVLRRIRKQREEAALLYAQAGRADLASAERDEIAIVEEFLPAVADEATCLAWVREAIAATGAREVREVGRVMGALMKAHRGAVDPALCRTFVERELEP